jgi:hypothetical protein
MTLSPKLMDSPNVSSETRVSRSFSIPPLKIQTNGNKKIARSKYVDSFDSGGVGVFKSYCQ